MAAAKRRGTEIQLLGQVVRILQKNARVQGIRLRSVGRVGLELTTGGF
jgi:hypothetical protein